MSSEVTCAECLVSSPWLYWEMGDPLRGGALGHWCHIFEGYQDPGPPAINAFSEYCLLLHNSHDKANQKPPQIAMSLSKVVSLIMSWVP